MKKKNLRALTIIKLHAIEMKCNLWLNRDLLFCHSTSKLHTCKDTYTCVQFNAYTFTIDLYSSVSERKFRITLYIIDYVTFLSPPPHFSYRIHVGIQNHKSMVCQIVFIQLRRNKGEITLPPSAMR